MFKTIDLHGYSKVEAKAKLTNYINALPKGKYELTVIHGYSSTILKNFVQKEFKHKKVIRKILTMNQGETIYMIES